MFGQILVSGPRGRLHTMFVVDDWGKHLVGPTRARLHTPFIFFFPFLVFVLLNMDHGGQELILSFLRGFILS